MGQTRERAVLLSMPRTGSTMVSSALAKHPQIHFVGAIFSRRGWGERDGIGRRALKAGLSEEWDDLAYRVAHRDELIDRYFGLPNDVVVRGFKHHLNGPEEVTDRVVHDNAFAKIVLTRNNYLACYSSNKIAVRARREGQIGTSKKTEFVVREFEKYMFERRFHYDRWLPKISAGGAPWMTLDYVEARTRDGRRSLFNFLGVDEEGAEAEVVTTKRNSDTVLDRFENPDDAMRYLRDNGLTGWVRESAQAPAAP